MAPAITKDSGKVTPALNRMSDALSKHWFTKQQEAINRFDLIFNTMKRNRPMSLAQAKAKISEQTKPADTSGPVGQNHQAPEGRTHPTPDTPTSAKRKFSELEEHLVNVLNPEEAPSTSSSLSTDSPTVKPTHRLTGWKRGRRSLKPRGVYDYEFTYPFLEDETYKAAKSKLEFVMEAGVSGTELDNFVHSDNDCRIALDQGKLVKNRHQTGSPDVSDTSDPDPLITALAERLKKLATCKSGSLADKTIARAEQMIVDEVSTELPDIPADLAPLSKKDWARVMGRIVSSSEEEDQPRPAKRRKLFKPRRGNGRFSAGATPSARRHRPIGRGRSLETGNLTPLRGESSQSKHQQEQTLTGKTPGSGVSQPILDSIRNILSGSTDGPSDSPFQALLEMDIDPEVRDALPGEEGRMGDPDWNQGNHDKLSPSTPWSVLSTCLEKHTQICDKLKQAMKAAHNVKPEGNSKFGTPKRLTFRREPKARGRLNFNSREHKKRVIKGKICFMYNFPAGCDDSVCRFVHKCSHCLGKHNFQHCHVRMRGSPCVP